MFSSDLLKNKSSEFGFTQCGVSRARFLEEEAPRLEQWLHEGKNGSMGYLENHFDKRLDPRLLVPGAKTVISLQFNYYPSDESLSLGPFKLARYAYGEDYHLILKEKISDLITILEPFYGTFEGRIFVDSAPILERPWAAQSGLGWIGKNTLLISKPLGSYFFLAEIVGNWNIQPDGPTTDHCGQCTRCIDACPTEALTPYGMDARKCISYLTIELKDQIPQNFEGQSNGWVFGCDICQEVCPWNRFSIPNTEARLQPSEQLKNIQWEDISPEIFSQIFQKSAIKRTKFEGIKRNISWVKS